MLSIKTVKNYLAVTDNFRDGEIGTMILGAEKFFEKSTNHVFGKQTRPYYFPFRVYDWPIHDTTGLRKIGTCWSKYDTTGILGQCPNQYFELEVGYETENDIPEDIFECLLQIIKVWYFEGENESGQTLFPPSVKQVMFNNRRFLI